MATPFAVVGDGGDGGGRGDDGEQEGDDEEDKVDPDAVGVAKMRVSEIKAELDVRGIGYAGIFEKVRLIILHDDVRIHISRWYITSPLIGKPCRRMSALDLKCCAIPYISGRRLALVSRWKVSIPISGFMSAGPYYCMLLRSRMMVVSP